MSEGSYLIRNMIKFAVLGRPVELNERSKESITKKAYLRDLKRPTDIRNFVLERATSRPDNISSSKIQIGDSVGRLLTQQMPQGVVEGFQGSKAAQIGRGGLDTFDSESGRLRND